MRKGARGAPHCPSAVLSSTATPTPTPLATPTPVKVYRDFTSLPPIKRKKYQTDPASPATQEAAVGRALPPPQDLPVGSRPFEGARIVRQTPIRALPPGTHPEVLRQVAEVLTFDPRESEPMYLTRVQHCAQYLLKERKDFAAIDVIADTLRQKRIIGPSGTWALSYFYMSLKARASAPQFQTDERLLKTWLRARPDSIAARECLGCLLIDWAWEARDAGPAGRDWRLYVERLQRAQSTFLEATRLGADPYIYGELLIVGKGLQLDHKTLHGYLESSMKIDKLHVWLAYKNYSDCVLPRWGGSAQEHRAFVDEVVGKTRAELGDTLYAVIMGSTHGRAAGR